MVYAFVVQSCPSANALLEGTVKQTMHPQTRGTGIANAHFAYADDVATLVETIVNKLSSNGKTLLHLCLSHRRFVQEIATPVRAYLFIKDSRIGR